MKILCPKNIKIHFLFLIIIGLKVNIYSQKNSYNFIKKSGDYLQIALPVGALVSTYFYQGNDKPHWQFIKSYVTSMIITHSLKRIISKPRPDCSDNLSFPSGHTTAAFAGAGFLQIRYGWKIGIPAYLLASYVAYTRIAVKKHDIYDVTAGAFVGILSNILFVKKFKKHNKQVFLGKINNFYILSFKYNF